MATILGTFAHAFLYIVGFFVFHCPFIIKKLFARSFSTLWFYVLLFKKNVILHNLAFVFPRKSDESMKAFKLRCETLARENMVHMVLCLFEILERYHWTQKTVEERVQLSGFEHVHELQKKNQGFFFLTAHLGNWELITFVGIKIGIRLAIITKYLRNKFANALWIKSRKNYGLELLDESGSGLAVVKCIRRGGAVGFILDQHTGEPHGIEAKFLGRSAWCPKGLAILSQRLECPVVPSFLLRLEDGTFRLHFLAPLSFPLIKHSDREYCTESSSLTTKALRYHIGICNEIMEGWILRYPDQYLWMHKRFKNVLNYSAPLSWQL